MEGFEEFLRKSQVREKYIPYYVRWVTKCYGFLEKKFNDRVDTFQKDRFLEHIARKHEEWQVKQADYAIKLYQYFLSQIQGSKEEKTPSPDDWQRLIEEVSRATSPQAQVLSDGENLFGMG